MSSLFYQTPHVIRSTRYELLFEKATTFDMYWSFFGFGLAEEEEVGFVRV